MMANVVITRQSICSHIYILQRVPNPSDLSIYWHDRTVFAELCSTQQEVMQEDAQFKPIDPSQMNINLKVNGCNQFTNYIIT